VTTPFLSARLAVAVAAVASACRVTRHVQQQNAIGQHRKGDSSPVTVADYAAQAIIARHLGEHDAHLALVGEEDAASLRGGGQDALCEAVAAAARIAWPGAGVGDVLDAIDRGNHDASGASYWTLDPVDGTKGFLRGGQYAVSLALIERGEVVLGVLGCPNLGADLARPFDQADPDGVVFMAERGSGAWSVPGSAPEAPPAPVFGRYAETVAGLRVCQSVEAGHSRLDDTELVVRHLGAHGTPARLDSQCKYAVVARGQADVYLRLPTSASYVEKIWDHAAGKLLAEEAGALVSDVHGRPLDFTHGAGLSANRGVVCAAPAFHAAVLEAIGALGLR
jgi:3'(2'), 5'-bisphosphate nucleotidase